MHASDQIQASVQVEQAGHATRRGATTLHRDDGSVCELLLSILSTAFPFHQTGKVPSTSTRFTTMSSSAPLLSGTIEADDDSSLTVPKGTIGSSTSATKSTTREPEVLVPGTASRTQAAARAEEGGIVRVQQLQSEAPHLMVTGRYFKAIVASPVPRIPLSFPIGCHRCLRPLRALYVTNGCPL